MLKKKILNNAAKTCLYGPKISENIEIEHISQSKAFFILVGISTQVALWPLKFRVSQVVHETVNFVINF